MPTTPIPDGSTPRATATQILRELAREGGEARLASRRHTVADVIGEAAAVELMSAAAVLSQDTRRRVERAAGRVLELWGDVPGADKLTDWDDLPGRIDAWVALYVKRTVEDENKAGTRSTGNEAGSLCEAADRIWGRKVPWTLTAAARRAGGCDVRGKRSTREEISPGELLTSVDGIDAGTDDLRTRCDAAAMVIAALCGLPVSLVAGIATTSLKFFDYRGKKEAGFVLTIPALQTGIKVRRAVATKKEVHATRWTAGADPAVAHTLAPWHHLATRHGWTSLFPANPDELIGSRLCHSRTRGQLKKDTKVTTVSPDVLNRSLRRRLGRKTVSWHGARDGNSRALDSIEPPAPEWCKNVIQMRSNRKERGSRETYTKENLAIIASTSWSLRAQKWENFGPFMIPEGSEGFDMEKTAGADTLVDVDDDSDPPVRAPAQLGKRVRPKRGVTFDDSASRSTTAPAAVCGRCAAIIPEGDSTAWLCDEAPCEWQVCRTCEPGDPGDLRCAEHSPPKKKKKKTTKKK
jgi:hypothetical protein